MPSPSTHDARHDPRLLTLRAAISTPEGKRRYVRRLFATIADDYDFITRFLSYGQDGRWKHRLVDLAAPCPSDCALDLACGTGDVLFALAEHCRNATGLDITYRMLQLARFRAPTARGPDLVAGDMHSLPFDDARFQLVTTGYGLRNVSDLRSALSEIYRVLVPGGRFLSLDFNRPANAVIRTFYLAYLTVVGSVLGLILHRDPNTYRYIPESIRLYPGAAGVGRLMAELGFVDIQVLPLLRGLMAIHVAVKPARVQATAAARP
jgi:demethylmenaquinone methyltransferase / 2-methoxy-6-polyprenyl-1,4-benzoquinol methylase